MNRTLVIGDIHGGLRAVKQIFERANVTTNDTLIFLGDYVDGWSESPEVIEFLIKLKETHKCIFLRGNHDDLLLSWLEINKDNPQWFNHGGKITMEKYSLLSDEDKKPHIDFLKLLENQQVDEKIKKSYADFTIDNSTKGKVKLQVKKILDKILLND